MGKGEYGRKWKWKYLSFVIPNLNVPCPFDAPPITVEIVVASITDVIPIVVKLVWVIYVDAVV